MITRRARGCLLVEYSSKGRLPAVAFGLTPTTPGGGIGGQARLRTTRRSDVAHRQHQSTGEARCWPPPKGESPEDYPDFATSRSGGRRVGLPIIK